MRALVTLALLLIATTLAPAQPVTANTVLNAHLNNKEVRDQIEGKLLAIHEGFGWANAYVTATRKQEPLFCPPPRLEMEGSRLVDILRQQVQKDPDLGGYPAGMALLRALLLTYPC
jgi:hypothetical protein